MNITTSFIKGSRSSQCDWYYDLSINENNKIICFGDGHGDWTSKQIDYFKILTLEAIQIYKNDEVNILKNIYLYITNKWILNDEDIYNKNYGTSFIIIHYNINEDYCYYINVGDSILFFETNDNEIIKPYIFNWNTDYGKNIAQKINIILTNNNHEYMLIQRKDALEYEKRFLPYFNIFGYVTCVAETIGLLSKKSVNCRRNLSVESKCKIQYACSGLNEDGTDLEIEVKRIDNVKSIYMFSDGITSKGAIGLDCVMDKIYTIINKPKNTRIIELILNDTNLFSHFISNTKYKINDFKQISDDINNPNSLFSSKEHSEKIFNSENGWEVFKNFMYLWKETKILDTVWWEAIDEQIEYFDKRKTIEECDNIIEMVTRLAVLCISDDNTSGIKIFK